MSTDSAKQYQIHLQSLFIFTPFSFICFEEKIVKKKQLCCRESLHIYVCVCVYTQQLGEGDLNPGSPYKGDQVMPLSYKALG